MLLSMFPPELVSDIMSACGYFGSGVTVISANYAEEQGMPQVFTCLSDAYVQDEDVTPMLIGMQVMLLSTLKSGHGSGYYKEILKSAFKMPDALATQVANKVETIDSVVGEGAGMAEAAARYMVEGLRRAWNYVMPGAVFDFEQGQANDIDFLLEVMSLGKAMQDFQKRARLISAGAKLTLNSSAVTSMGDPLDSDTFETGDVDLYGDPDSAMMGQIGDVFARVGSPTVPSSMYGGLNSIHRLASAASMAQAVAVVNKTGMAPVLSSSKTFDEIKSKVSNPRIAKAASVVESIRKANPVKAALVGAALGALPVLAGKLIAGKFAKGAGDPDSESLLGDIADEYGNEIAQAWQTGDIDSIVKQALGDIHDFDPDALGDPEVSADVDHMIATGDIDYDNDSVQTGGLFTRWKLAAAERRAARKQRRSIKRKARLDAKAAKARRLAELRRAAAEADAGYFDDSENASEHDPGYQETSVDAETGSEGGYPGLDEV